MIILILAFIERYSISLTFITVLITGFWGFIKFRVYINDQRFNTYHRIIKELVDESDPKRDRQSALIYELRNFPSYYEFTVRILKDIRASWFNEERKNDPIIREIDLTLKYIENKKCYFNS